MCFHVDDGMISGPKHDPEFERTMVKAKRLYEYSTNLTSVVSEYDKQQTNRYSR